MYLTRERKLKM